MNPEASPFDETGGSKQTDGEKDGDAKADGSNADAFGWSEDYALKDVNVSNTRSGNWAHFWRKDRLLCHLPHLDPELARRVKALAEHMEDLLPSAPDMALVHGDLWASNIVHANDN